MYLFSHLFNKSDNTGGAIQFKVLKTFQRYSSCSPNIYVCNFVLNSRSSCLLVKSWSWLGSI